MNETCALLVAGIPADLVGLVARPANQDLTTTEFELKLPASVVLHELQESCDPAITEEGLAAFLAADAACAEGREAYVDIAKAVAGIRKEAGPPQWAWVQTTDVALTCGVVIFSGRAHEYDKEEK